jgi:hypothetical protein
MLANGKWDLKAFKGLISSSSALPMSEKCKSASPSAVRVKNWRKTIGIEEN